MYKCELLISDTYVVGEIIKKIPNLDGITDKLVLDLLNRYSDIYAGQSRFKGYLKLRDRVIKTQGRKVTLYVADLDSVKDIRLYVLTKDLPMVVIKRHERG